jgi:hypothetical protein
MIAEVSIEKWPKPGDYHQWPEKWVRSGLTLARSGN